MPKKPKGPVEGRLNDQSLRAGYAAMAADAAREAEVQEWAEVFAGDGADEPERDSFR